MQEKVWGGFKLNTLFHKPGAGPIGESWEISGVKDNISRVSNGPLQGISLTALISEYTTQLMGDKVYARFGEEFPLLFKFIDAREDLSVQLHPNDQLAKERHNSFGKTEMWYIMQAEEDARLIMGFSETMDQSTYLEHLSGGAITDILNEEQVKPGDSFLINPGTVHAIGSGIVLAEIQQTSDITYRIYDWDRPGMDGTMRTLHTEEALAAISYETSDAKLKGTDTTNEANLLCTTPYFETRKWILSENIELNLEERDSFTVFMCMDGDAILRTEDHSETLRSGETLLVPANFSNLELQSANATLLEVYIP